MGFVSSRGFSRVIRPGLLSSCSTFPRSQGRAENPSYTPIGDIPSNSRRIEVGESTNLTIKEPMSFYNSCVIRIRAPASASHTMPAICGARAVLRGGASCGVTARWSIASELQRRIRDPPPATRRRQLHLTSATRPPNLASLPPLRKPHPPRLETPLAHAGTYLDSATSSASFGGLYQSESRLTADRRTRNAREKDTRARRQTRCWPASQTRGTPPRSSSPLASSYPPPSWYFLPFSLSRPHPLHGLR